jgi:hypothetical protein
MPKTKLTAKLTTEQLEIVGQFNDYSFEYPKLNFDQAAKKALGPKPFPNNPNGKAFRREAKAVFEQERQK